MRPPNPSGSGHPGNTPNDSIPTANRQALPDEIRALLDHLLTPCDGISALGRFGDYRVLGVLGAGGMGVVLRAEDEKLHRLVALKLLRPAAVLPKAKERFLREARAMAAVEHPRVVIVHQVGEVDGTPFIAMPLMKGRSLAARLKDGPPLALAEAVVIARETAEGLAAAHARGLVHRDVKPDNIWLEDTAEGTHVRLLDFGLARGDGEASLTQPGALVGTPSYMSPEQAAGKKVDARADLFSLGAVLYELVTRQRAFPGSDLFSILHALSTQTPAPPMRVNSAVPAVLSELIVRLLAKDPAGRPGSAAEVAAALRVVEDHLSGVAEAPTIDRPLLRPARPRGVLWGGALAAGIAAIVGAWWWLAPRDTGPPGPPPPTPEALAVVVPPVIPESIRVKSIDVKHFARLGPTEGDPRGVIGKESFGAALGDQVTVDAKLSRPGYAYLLAFRPDGVVELCFPDDEADRPPLTDNPRYPSRREKADRRYGLREGTGLWVFAVVASEKELPPYRDWLAGRKPAWGPVKAPAGTVWWDDGQWLEAWRANGVVRGDRAKDEEALGPAGPVVRLTNWLREGGRTTAGTIGFAVGPRE